MVRQSAKTQADPRLVRIGERSSSARGYLGRQERLQRDKRINACDACTWRSLDALCSVGCSCKSHKSVHDDERLGNPHDGTLGHQSMKRLSL
jgi:hypothetical protein